MGGDDSQKLLPRRGTYSSPRRSHFRLSGVPLYLKDVVQVLRSEPSLVPAHGWGGLLQRTESLLKPVGACVQCVATLAHDHWLRHLPLSRNGGVVPPGPAKVVPYATAINTFRGLSMRVRPVDRCLGVIFMRTLRPSAIETGARRSQSRCRTPFTTICSLRNGTLR
jgi:hypothetical protein